MVLYDMYYNNTISSLLLNLSRNLETTIQKILTNTQDVTNHQQYPPYCAYIIAQLPPPKKYRCYGYIYCTIPYYSTGTATTTGTVSLFTV